MKNNNNINNKKNKPQYNNIYKCVYVPDKYFFGITKDLDYENRAYKDSEFYTSEEVGQLMGGN